MFTAGARPVIYGLSGDVREQPSNGDFRILDERLLPQQEQYRYVTYTIGDVRQIDWTHEREWRWPYQGEELHWSENGDLVETLRSEEHTSELQSLMRISYAVFCLKKKNTK